MNILFQKTNAYWARYSEYEYRQGEDAHLYLMPCGDHAATRNRMYVVQTGQLRML